MFNFNWESLVALFTVWLGLFSPLPVDELNSTNQATATSTVAIVKSVIDGDTITVLIDGQKETVRYIGIDTPEPYAHGAKECGSQEATNYNQQLVPIGSAVRLVADRENRDQYGRLLRYVYLMASTTAGDEVMVNQDLLRLGLAKPLTIAPNTTWATEFKALAAAAKQSGLGNWSLCSDN